MKYTKLFIGLIIAVIALWIIVREQMTGASANAFINAPVVTVRAPVAGDLQIRARSLGSNIENNIVLASIEDPLVDRIRLDDLLMEVRLERAALIRIEGLLEDTASIRDALIARGQIFRERRLEELRTRLSHAQNRLEIIENRIADGTLENMAERDQRFLETVEEDIERLPAEPRLDALLLDHARERVAVLQIALNAAEEGVFLGDGYNDSPNSEQRVAELESDLAALAQQRLEAQERLAAVLERSDQERRSVNRLTGRELRAPVAGLLWEILEANGVNVQRGDPVMRLVDCEALIVTLSVTERIYNRLELGQAARFRLGGSSTVYDATISRLAGSGAATVYEHLAVAPSGRHLERFDVTLTAPDLRQADGASCPIGRTGRVFFDTRPLDWLRSLLS